MLDAWEAPDIESDFRQDGLYRQRSHAINLGKANATDALKVTSAAFMLIGSNCDEVGHFERIVLPIYRMELNKCALTWIDGR